MKNITSIKNLFPFNLAQYYHDFLERFALTLKNELDVRWKSAKELNLHVEVQFESINVQDGKTILNTINSTEADFIVIWPHKLYEEGKGRQVSIVIDDETRNGYGLVHVWFHDDNNTTVHGPLLPIEFISSEEFIAEVITWLETFQEPKMSLEKSKT